MHLASTSGKKICSLGLRIRKGCSFHGLALNVAMDLSPFLRINPCGYAGMSMTQLKNFQPEVTTEQVHSPLVSAFARLSGYENVEWISGDLPVKP